MTTTIHANGSKWAGQPPDDIEKLIAMLTAHPLDLELSSRTAEPGWWTFRGNFQDVSHVFHVETDEPDLAMRVGKAYIRSWLRAHELNSEAIERIMEGMERERADWARIAKQNGWYSEPFYVHVRAYRNGTIESSVSNRCLTRDGIRIPRRRERPPTSERRPEKRGDAT